MAPARTFAAVVGFVAALAGVPGCGDGPAAPPAYAATFGVGSRLKPTVLTIGGGIDSIEEWTDTQLGFRCAHRPTAEDGIAEDGVERCLPYGNSVVFSDAGCTTAILAREDNQGCPYTAQFAVSNTAVNECTVRKRIYRVAAEIPTPPRVFLANGTDYCVEFDVTGLAATYFALEAMPPSAFVAINRTTRERAPGMRAEVWEGDDGSWEITGFFDESRGEACGHHYDAAELRCVPSRRLYVGDNYFVDASCQMPAAEVSPPVCDPRTPRVGYKRVGMTDGCFPKDIFEYHELVDTGMTGWGHTRRDDGSCAPYLDPPGPPLYGVGSTISPASFPSFQPLEYGPGRVRLTFLGFGDRPFIPHWGYAGSRFFDSQAGLACSAIPFADGKIWCASGYRWARADGVGYYYAAQDCTGARILELGDSTSDPCSADPKHVLVEGNPCDGSIREVRAISRFTGSTLHVLAPDGTCSPISPADLERPAYVEGEVLDPATLFPEIQRVQRN